MILIKGGHEMTNGCLSLYHNFEIILRSRRKKLPEVVLKIFVEDHLVIDRHNTTIDFFK
jgi:hypothetical protein